MHPRRIIRNAVAARLGDAVPDTDPVAYRTAVGPRVYPSRTRQLFPDRDLPAVLVYTRSERVEVDGAPDGFGPLTRHLNLAVEVVAGGRDGDLNDTLDDIAEQVEAALDGWDIPGREADVIRLVEVETDFDAQGERIIGATRLTYTVTYMTAPTEAAPDDLPERVFIGYSPDIGIDHEPDYEELT